MRGWAIRLRKMKKMEMMKMMMMIQDLVISEINPNELKQ